MEFNDIHSVIEQVAAAYAAQNPPESLLKLQELWYRLCVSFLEWLRNLDIPFSMATDSRKTSDLLIWIIYMLGALCAVSIIYALVHRAMKIRYRLSQLPAENIVLEPISDAARWKAEAVKLALDGDYRAACRALYLSVLRLFEQFSIAEYVPAKTNYEYLYLLKKFPDLQEDFRNLYQSVEKIWFGWGDAAQQDYMHCLEICTEIETKVFIVKQGREIVANKQDINNAR